MYFSSLSLLKCVFLSPESGVGWDFDVVDLIHCLLEYFTEMNIKQYAHVHFEYKRSINCVDEANMCELPN